MKSYARRHHPDVPQRRADEDRRATSSRQTASIPAPSSARWRSSPPSGAWSRCRSWWTTIAAGRTPPAGTVCITFDDGYRDNLTVAAPILEKYRLPATLFLATGFVERGETQWSDTAALAVAAGPEHRRLHAQLLEASHDERMRLLGEFEAGGEAAAPDARLGRGARARAALSALRDRRAYARPSRPHQAPRRGARADRGLRRGPAARARRPSERHFSYPYGRWSAETRQAVIDAGWRSAVAADAARRIGPATDRYAMPRVAGAALDDALRLQDQQRVPRRFSALLGIA